jgi:hypothetical protein
MLSPSSRAAGSFLDLFNTPRIVQAIPFDLLYTEANVALVDLYTKLAEDRFIETLTNLAEDRFVERLLGYASLAASTRPQRFAVDFAYTIAIVQEQGSLVLHDMPKHTFGSAIYVFLKDLQTHKNVGVDIFTRGLSLLE